MDFKIKNFQCLYVRVFSDAHASRFVWKKEKGPDLVPADGYRREKEKSIKLWMKDRMFLCGTWECQSSFENRNIEETFEHFDECER